MNKKYYLGEKYPCKYFSQREAICMLGMLQGLNCAQIADLISFSPKTIGIYFKSIQHKLRCKTKKELLYSIRQIDFMKIIYSIKIILFLHLFMEIYFATFLHTLYWYSMPLESWILAIVHGHGIHILAYYLL